MKIKTFLLGFTSLIVALCAAFFSVSGLGKLFAGASFEVMIMAGSLEFAKIVTASFLYTYWNKISRILKIYLTFGVVILILITSLGIYGFLTSAYQRTADELNVIDSKIAVIELRKEQYQLQLDLAVGEREGVNQSIASLTSGLSNVVNQTIDRQTGQLVTNVSTTSQRVINTQLTEAQNRQDIISTNIVSLSDSIGILNQKILEVKNESIVSGEVGPLRYLADITGMEMNMIVNLFALLIVFVFDPLAVSLVIAFNIVMKLDKDEKFNESIKKQNYKIYGDDPIQKITNDVIEDLPPIIKKVTLSYESQPIDDIVEKTTDDIVESEIKDELSNLKIDTSRRGVDIDGDGTIDGYDTNGDGLIDEVAPSSMRRAEYVKVQKPYYARPNFNWNDRKKWIYDQNAINYYLTHVKTDDVNNQLYPKDFYTKTY